MKEFIKKHFWIILILLYVFSVLAFLGAYMLFEINKSSIYDFAHLNEDLNKALLFSISPLFYPLYKYIKFLKSGVSE